jgi:thiol-disulfide isomerase/thioredoxin
VENVRVINFWATWCKPCIKELPYFESAHRNYQDKNVEIILVSLDMAEQADSRVIPFLEKKSITSPVVLLDETDFDPIITYVSDQWSGAIPATLIIDRSGKKEFYEREFEKNELDHILNKYL